MRMLSCLLRLALVVAFAGRADYCGAVDAESSSAEVKLEHAYFAEMTEAYLKTAGPDSPRPPLVLLPGLLSSRLIAWRAKKCRGPDIQIQDIVWLSLAKMIETTTFDRTCWLDCLKLDKNGSDPEDCKIRPDEGLGAIGELSPGNLYTPPATSIFTPLIRMLALDLGYDVNSIIGAPYDWRLSPIELETRDSFFTTFKYRLETAVRRHRRPAIVMAHSMGNNVFLYFCEWLRLVERPPMGYRRWLRRHIWGYVGFAAPLLGAPMALKSVLSGHNFGLTISEAQARELQLTFASTHFLNPRATRSGQQGSPSSSPSSSSDAHTHARANTTVRGSKRVAAARYEVPIVSVRSATGGSTVQFGLPDIENGEIFRICGSLWGEPLMMEKHSQLFSLYKADPLQPLKDLPRRPPIRHMLLIYGVNTPTEVGYVYRLEQSVDGVTLPPVLEEILYEEVACGGGGRGGVSTSQASLECKRENYAVAAQRAGRVDGSTDDNAGAVCRVESSPDAPAPSPAPSSPSDSTSTPNPMACRVDIVSRSRRAGRTGIHIGKGRTIHTSAQHRTGDVTVPYLSLSYAHAWLEGEEGEGGEEPRRWHERRDEKVHRHILDNWAPSTMASKVVRAAAASLFLPSLSTMLFPPFP